MNIDLVEKGKEKEFVFSLIFIVFVCAIQWLFFKSTVGEIVLYFYFGCTFAWLIHGKIISIKYRSMITKAVFVFMFVGWVVAVIFDPILKPILDEIFHVNTVPTFQTSFVNNSLVFLSFVVGYGIVLILYKVWKNI